jgi:hypothetical protein
MRVPLISALRSEFGELARHASAMGPVNQHAV